MATQSHASLVDFGKKHVTNGLARQIEGVMTEGEGSYVAFGDGKRMLDFTTGIGVTNLGKQRVLCGTTQTDFRLAGHCHPKVSAAAAKQCMEIVHAQVRSQTQTQTQKRVVQPTDLLMPTVQHRVPRPVPRAHQAAPPNDARPLARLVLLLELRFRGHRGCYQDGTGHHRQAEYHSDARRVPRAHVRRYGGHEEQDCL